MGSSYSAPHRRSSSFSAQRELGILSGGWNWTRYFGFADSAPHGQTLGFTAQQQMAKILNKYSAVAASSFIPWRSTSEFPEMGRLVSLVTSRVDRFDTNKLDIHILSGIAVSHMRDKSGTWSFDCHSYIWNSGDCVAWCYTHELSEFMPTWPIGDTEDANAGVERKLQ